MVKSGFPICTEKDVILGVLPFYHIYGILPISCKNWTNFFVGAVKILHCSFYLGATVVIMPRFEPYLFCGSIEKYNATGVFVVPPICLVLLNHPGMPLNRNASASLNINHKRWQSTP
jgi:4-coumarate--CoA ligase